MPKAFKRLLHSLRAESHFNRYGKHLKSHIAADLPKLKGTKCMKSHWNSSSNVQQRVQKHKLVSNVSKWSHVLSRHWAFTRSLHLNLQNIKLFCSNFKLSKLFSSYEIELGCIQHTEHEDCVFIEQNRSVLWFNNRSRRYWDFYSILIE